MTLTERIQALRKDREELEKTIREQRHRYWDDRLKKPHQWDNESDAHFKARQDRDERREKRKHEMVELLVKKKDAIQKEIDKLAAHKHEVLIPNPDPDGNGWATFDGKMVAAWMVGANPDHQNYLEAARKSGLWHGVIVSGGRTPEYSESLCRAMCGAPQCPGRCAGRASNHASNDGFPLPINGAIDVSDPDGFERAMHEIGCHYLINDLPVDPVHFSPSGR